MGLPPKLGFRRRDAHRHLRRKPVVQDRRYGGWLLHSQHWEGTRIVCPKFEPALNSFVAAVGMLQKKINRNNLKTNIPSQFFQNYFYHAKIKLFTWLVYVRTLDRVSELRAHCLNAVNLSTQVPTSLLQSSVIGRFLGMELLYESLCP